MIDATHPQAIAAETVLEALEDRGFALRPAGEHVLATHDAVRVVVPGPGRHLPDTFVRRLEHSLRPVLGAGWLRGPAPASPPSPSTPSPDEVAVLEAVVDQCPASGEWCSYLLEELSVMGTGTTREAALRDLKAAAAVWLGLPPGHLALLTPDVV